MKLKDEKGWNEYVLLNTDGSYSEAVVTYSKRWAELMEEKLDAGMKLVDIAEDTSHEANAERITGFQYGCAVEGLAKYWEYGEELRRWHNLDTQLGNEGEKANKSGGTLNPAILNIGK